VTDSLLKGFLLGVFASSQKLTESFAGSVAKRSETDGTLVYARTQWGQRYSFLADASFPDRIQGYARVASICDHAYYIFPGDGKLTPPDGELAVLIDSFSLRGTIEVIGGDALGTKELVRLLLKGVRVSEFPVEGRESNSSIIDLEGLKARESGPSKGTLLYLDRAFSVKGVGVVVLGFILSGKISVHDKLRILPGGEKTAEVKGIQISDEDFESAERGIRVGLSLKGVELKDLEKASWMDDGSFALRKRISLNFSKSAFFKQPVVGRDLHLQVNGEMVVARFSEGGSPAEVVANLPREIPCWDGMRAAVIDLNSKPLRIAGGGSVVRLQ